MSKWDGNLKYRTKDCDECAWYRLFNNEERCVWGVAYKVLVSPRKKPRKCEVRNRFLDELEENVVSVELDSDKPHVQFKKMIVKEIALSLINKNNQIFLVKRRYEPYSGFWSFPGGGLKRGESLENAVIRETKEETNLNIRVIHKVESFIYDENSRRNRIHVFFCRTDSMEYNINEKESLDGGWFGIEEIREEGFKLIPELRIYTK